MTDEITRLRAEIARLTDLCAAYKGQVEAGAVRIESAENLVAELEAQIAALQEPGGLTMTCLYLRTCSERRKLLEERDTATRALSDLRGAIEAALKVGCGEDGDETTVIAILRQTLAKAPLDPRPTGDDNV